MSGSHNPWISFSDIMTALMVVFMFIAISYIVEIDQEQKERNKIIEEFRDVKAELFDVLREEFSDDFKQWGVELDRDLSIKFTNPEVLFASGRSDLTPRFKAILDDFFPRYLDIIMKPKYADRISEVRIEGHTDTTALRFYGDSYISNTVLSQLRSSEVLRYLRAMPRYRQLTGEEEKQLQFWLTSNGLSYGRTLDDNKELTAYSNRPVNNEYSRRVEFRIVTTSDEVVEEFLRSL